MESHAEAEVPRGPRSTTAVLIAVVAFAIGGGAGWLLGSSDADSTPVAVAPAASGRTASPAPLGLEPTLTSYLGALVAHDWPHAHALMCADLGEQVSAGQLKQELTDSQGNAGALEGFTITSQPSDATGTATVEYDLEFARGTLAITADLEQEGDAWRVCSFTNGGGTGAFA